MQVCRATVEWFLDNGGQELVIAHREEVPALHSTPSALIDFDLYFKLEDQGVLLILVALDSENSIQGYVIGCAVPAIHDKGKYDFGTTAFYTRPEVRGQGISRELFSTLRTYCGNVGVSTIRYNVNETYPETKAAVKALGMVKAETVYSIQVEE